MEKRRIGAALSDMEGLIRAELDEGGSVSFTPRGGSMLPMLRANGDSVTLEKPPARLKRGTVALFVMGAGEEKKFVLHRLVKVKRRRDEYVFMGDKRDKADPPVKREDIIGVVTAFTSRGRASKLKEPGYKLYSSWMVLTRGVRPVSFKLQSAAYRAWRKLSGRK